MNGKPWTKEELTYLKRWYGIKNPSRIAKELGRSKRSIYSKAMYLGLTMSHIGWEKGKRRTHSNSKIDNVEYEPKKLNAPKQNWLAFFICTQKNISIDRALGIMGVRAEFERYEDKLAHIENMSFKEIYGEVE